MISGPDMSLMSLITEEEEEEEGGTVGQHWHQLPVVNTGEGGREGWRAYHGAQGASQ